MKRRSKAVWLEIMLLNIVLLNYVCNKMFIQEYTQHWFMRSYWNDVLAGICLAILSDWLTRFWLKKTISVMGIFYIVLGAGIYWEYVGPLYISYSVSDASDMIAYVLGSIIYIIFRRKIYRGGCGMYCSQCGSKVEEGTKFCSSCGARLDFAEEPKVEEKTEVTTANKIEKSGESQKLENSKIEKGEVTAAEISKDSEKRNETNTQPRTLEQFRKELEDLKEKDVESKSVVAFLGTSFFDKQVYPILRENEVVVAIRHIQSKVLFARARKEVLVVTNQRVLIVEKMQYCKAKVTGCLLSQIISIEAGKQSNGLYGIFIGEKLCIKCPDNVITVRTVGKGAAQQLADEIVSFKKLYSSELTSSQSLNSTTKAGKTEKNRSLKKLGLSIVGGVAAIFLILIIIGVFADSGSKDFYDYLPLAKADVEEFLFKENFENNSSPDLYMKEEDYVILNEEGNIEMISILMPGYAFCDVEIGDNFDVLKDSKKFTDHGYSLLSEDEDAGEIYYGLPDGQEELGGDQLISMYLDGNKEVTGILFYRTGAKEFVESLEEDFDTLLETEETEPEAETEIVSTTDGNAEYFFADSDKRRLSEEEIEPLSEIEKLYAATEILARHGVDFSTIDDGGLLENYFGSKSWYQATKDDIENSELNEYELFNAALIMKCMESTKSEFILPESDTRYLTHEDLAGMDTATLRLARNEIFARHGRAFETEDLNEYFSAKSWYYGYLSAEEFDDSVLNEYEKANLDLIKEAETGSSFDENAQKELSGLYEIQFDSYGGAELEIQYYSGEDAYYATLSGSYYDAAGFVEGYLSAYTDGSDGIWELYEPYDTVPVLRLIYDGKDFITIESLNGDTYGGVNFPGFSGTYKRTKEYQLP